MTAVHQQVNHDLMTLYTIAKETLPVAYLKEILYGNFEEGEEITGQLDEVERGGDMYESCEGYDSYNTIRNI